MVGGWLEAKAGKGLAVGHARVPADLFQKLAAAQRGVLLLRLSTGDGGAYAIVAAVEATPKQSTVELSPALLTAMRWTQGTQLQAAAQDAERLPVARRVHAATEADQLARATQAAAVLEETLLQQMRVVKAGLSLPLAVGGGKAAELCIDIISVENEAGGRVLGWARLDSRTEVELAAKATQGAEDAAHGRGSRPAVALRLRAVPWHARGENEKRGSTAPVVRANLPCLAASHPGGLSATLRPSATVGLGGSAADSSSSAPSEQRATTRAATTGDSGSKAAAVSQAQPQAQPESEPRTRGQQRQQSVAGAARQAPSGANEAVTVACKVVHDDQLAPGHVAIEPGLFLRLKLPHGALCILRFETPVDPPVSAARLALEAERWVPPPPLNASAVGSIAGEGGAVARLARELHQTLWPDAAGRAAGAPGTLGALVTGLRGIGKSFVAQKALDCLQQQSYWAAIHTVDCKQLLGKQLAARLATVRHALRDAQQTQPSVVLLDDLDALLPSSQENQPNDSETDAMALLLADALFAALHPPCVDGAAPPRVCIVATSQAMDALPAPLLRPWLWSTCHTLEAPDQMAREALLATLLRDAAQDPARCEAQQAPADFSQLAARTEGFVAVDFAALVASAAHLMDTSADSAASGVAREHKCWVEALDGALLAHSPLHLSALGATKVEVTLRHVGGMTEAKAQLTEVLAWPLLYPALMQGLPVKRPAGVLLYGPSGCGKTLLAQAIAGEYKLRFVSIKGPELLNKYIGASEQAVRDLFARAQAAAPCVLFFDELEAIAPPRGQSSSGVTDRVVNQLLTHLDGVEARHGVFVLAATSRPELVDPALLRPGRLDVAIACVPPGVDEREAILTVHTGGLSMAGDVDLAAVAAATEGCSGADLRAIVTDAQLAGVHALQAEGGLTNTRQGAAEASLGIPLYCGSADEPVAHLDWDELGLAGAVHPTEADGPDGASVLTLTQARLLAAAGEIAAASRGQALRRRAERESQAIRGGSRMTMA